MKATPKIQVLGENRSLLAVIADTWETQISVLNTLNPITCTGDYFRLQRLIREEGRLFAAEFDMVFEIINNVHTFTAIELMTTQQGHLAPPDTLQQFSAV